MDMIIFLIASIGVSIYKIIRYGEDESIVTIFPMNEEETTALTGIPVGNNLMLKRDRHAFMLILYQLGVVNK